MKLQIVHIQWVDSEAIAEWEELHVLKHEMEVVETVGLLVHQDKDCYLVASAYDNERKAINAAIWIPKCAVKNIRDLGHIKIKQ